MPETVIRSRVDAALKLEAQALLEKVGLSMSEAIRLFLYQVVMEKGLPFRVKLSGDAAQEHDRWFRNRVETALAKADDPATEFIPHETVSSKWEKRKNALRARANEE